MWQSTPAVAGPSARIYLAEIGAPVVARVTHRGPDRMTVRRALPFLKLHSSVRDEGGRRAEVAGVSVVIEDGTPQLVLELAYGADEVAAEPLPESTADKRARDATVPYVVDRSSVTPAPVARPATRREATLQFVTVRASLEEGEPALLFEPPPLWLLTVRWCSALCTAALRGLSQALGRLASRRSQAPAA